MSLRLKERHKNAIRGLLVGYSEQPFLLGSSGPDHILPVEWPWIMAMIPGAGRVIDDLKDAGLAWQHDWSAWGGITAIGLTEKALAWAAVEYGIPADFVTAVLEQTNDNGFEAWIDENIESIFMRKTDRTTRATPDTRNETSH